MQKTLLDGSTQLPAAFDPPVYRQLWPDLADFDDDGLRQHYERFGINEGRQANALTNREDFVRLIPASADSLEIGPFYNPLLSGSHTRYFDVMDKAALEARSRAIGAQNAVAPEIDFISPIGDLSIVDADFDYVLSSHCIEHQPDLVGHLRQVSRLLRPGGRYFLLIPDKRFCFDALLAESTIADVLDAHHAQRKVHALKSVVEHRALTTHNNPILHWAGDHGAPVEDPGRVLASVQEFRAADGNYVDVHAWYFTPRSVLALFKMLHQTTSIDLDIEVIYPTRFNEFEFWMVLQKSTS